MPKAANCIQMSETAEGSAAAEEAIPHPLVTMSPVSTECCQGGLGLFLLSLCHHSSCSQALLALQSVKCSCLGLSLPWLPWSSAPAGLRDGSNNVMQRKIQTQPKALQTKVCSSFYLLDKPELTISFLVRRRDCEFRVCYVRLIIFFTTETPHSWIPHLPEIEHAVKEQGHPLHNLKICLK